MPAEKPKKSGHTLIRYIYLYLVTAISIVLLIISTIGFLNLFLDEYVFDVKGYDELNYEWQCVQGDEVKDRVLADDSEMDQECLEKAKQKAEFEHTNNVKDQFVTWLSMFIVALPLYLYHWGIIKKENNK